MTSSSRSRYNYSRHIGRIGALAVALGIGSAIAGLSVGVAAADDGGSTKSASSASSPASHSVSKAGPRKKTVKPTAAVAKAASAVSNSPQRPTTTTTTTKAAAKAAPAVTVAASPLGTPQQLNAEKIAAATMNTLPVQVVKLVLQLGWLAIAKSQYGMVGGPDSANVAQLKEAVDEYAMGAAFQQQILNSNAPTIVMQVAPPHDWYGQHVPGSRILYDNPDTIYRFTGVNAASSYVITGHVDLTAAPVDTNFSVLTGLSGVTASNLSGQQLVTDADGNFTITVSRAPAGPGDPNHLQLTSDSTLIAIRNTLSDWDSQEPMSLSIERVAGPPNSLFSQLGGFAIPGIGPLVVNSPLLTSLVSVIPPLPSVPPLLRGTLAAVVMLLGLSQENKYIQVATVDPTTGQRRQPNTLTNPVRNAQFLATQVQSAGYFQLTTRQALVVTIDPGDAGYFVVPVTNDWTITGNYWDQQTSLNSSQAIENADGTYTLVISPTDPGVANWVSTGGLNQGTISIRFQDLGGDPTTQRPANSAARRRIRLHLSGPRSPDREPAGGVQQTVRALSSGLTGYKRPSRRRDGQIERSVDPRLRRHHVRDGVHHPHGRGDHTVDTG
jgi:Protein of unknown function (DUF1214)